MDPAQRVELPAWQKGRLIVALVILSALAALCAVGIGETLHGWSETLDSLEHWRARQEEAVGGSETPERMAGFDSPASRVRRLEAELDEVPDRLFARVGMFLFSSVLVVLGLRKLREARRIG